MLDEETLNVYPPSVSKRAVALVPERMREDAVQEAWLAHLQRRNPTRAMKAYVERERWREQRTESLDAMIDALGDVV